MGLLIKLNNGDTSLKSLKFGKDRPGGGDSNQPYIKKPISNQPLSALDGDGLLRGGLRAPLRALDDTARLSKYFFDFKNPSGLIFTAKQNLLSRLGAKTEVAKEPPSIMVREPYSPNIAYGKGTINEGIYTPTSTILQAASNFIGGHLNKQGIDPTGLIENLSITEYGKVAYRLNLKENNVYYNDSPFDGGNDYVRAQQPSSKVTLNNRLLDFWSKRQSAQPPKSPIESERFSNSFPQPGFNSSVLYSYSGGAGSILGIGDTSIKFATLADGITPLRTGVNNSSYIENPKEFLKGKKLPVNRTYINYVDGVPLIQSTLNEDKFIKASAIYGIRESQNRTNYLDNFDTGTLLGLQNYQYLYDTNLDLPNPKPGNKSYQPEAFKFQIPIGASSRYNASLQPLINNNINGLKLDFENIKTLKIEKLNQQIQNLQSQQNSSDQYQSEKVNVDVNNSFNQKISRLERKIAKLQSSTFDINNVDGPAPILKSSLGKALQEGDISFYYGNENKSVYKKDNQGNPTLVQRNDSDYNNLTPTLNDILNRRQIVYKANTTDKRFPSIVLENRVHAGDPGSTNGSRTKALDKINAKAPYTATTGKGHGFRSQNANDFAHFRIGILDPFIPQNAAYMNFRALIEDISDNYSAEWNAQKYMGRAEKFYKYGGFDRKMSLSFKVVVMSQAEMPAIYSKLNYLASSLAPSYSPQGYMAGNIALLTLGDYVHEQYGIITSLNYKIPPESSWELIIGEGAGLDELPFMIDVSMNFTPIHNFRPEVGNHNRYITKNMRLPYSGKQLKDIRDDEYTPEEIPPLPKQDPLPDITPPTPPPAPITSPEIQNTYAVVADKTRTNSAGQAAVDRQAQDVVNQFNQFKTPSTTNSNLGDGADDYFKNNNVPGMDGNSY